MSRPCLVSILEFQGCTNFSLDHFRCYRSENSFFNYQPPLQSHECNVVFFGISQKSTEQQTIIMTLMTILSFIHPVYRFILYKHAGLFEKESFETHHPINMQIHGTQMLNSVEKSGGMIQMDISFQGLR